MLKMFSHEVRGRSAGFLSVLLLMSLLFLSGCAQELRPIPLWGGFDYAWERLSHRISFFRSTVGPASPDGSFTVEQGLIGGPWSLSSALPEVVNYRTPWWWVQSSSLSAYRASVDLEIGATGLVQQDISLSLDAIGLDPSEVVTVALGGLSLNMDVPQGPDFPADYDPAEGWTPQVFGAGVENIVHEAGSVSFSLWLQFQAGPLDREDMNEALEFLTIQASLTYLVLGAEGAYSEAVIEASSWYPIDPPNSEIPPMDLAQRTALISGVEGLPLAVPLIRSWQFTLNRELAGEGRYLRALAMAIEDFEYEPSSGEARLVLDAYCSHSSAIEEGELQVEFKADVGLLQLESASSSVLSGELAGGAAVGAFEELVVP